MTLPVQPPRLPSPTNEYDRAYMDSLLGELAGFIRSLNTPGELRGTTLVLTNLPSDPYGKEVGTVYEIDGVVKVIRTKDIFFVVPTTAASSVGTVSVSLFVNHVTTAPSAATASVGTVTTTP